MRTEKFLTFKMKKIAKSETYRGLKFSKTFLIYWKKLPFMQENSLFI